MNIIISICSVLMLCYLSTVECQNNLTIISTNNQNENESSDQNEESIDDLLTDLNQDEAPIITSVIKISKAYNSSNTNEIIEHIVHSTCLLISIPFLIVTFIVYGYLPELKNNRGSILMTRYIGSLSIAFGILIIIKFHLLETSKYLCIIAGLVCYFFFISSFFWLNVMSYDIWKTIGSVQNCGFKCKKMRLFIYSFYVWGSTSVLTIVIVIIEFSPKIPDYFIKPGLNNGHCWFTSINLAGEYIFFTGPMGIIIFFNILFFILSFIKARNIKRNLINHTNRQDSQRHDDNSQWFYLCFKLSIVTGICWSFEIISKIYLDIFEGHGWLWIIPDLFNTLQGLIIFIIFVCTGKPKKQILKIFFTTKNKLIQ